MTVYLYMNRRVYGCLHVLGQTDAWKCELRCASTQVVNVR